MGWSITEYDSLRLLYVEPNGYPHIFRKSLTRFEHRVPAENFIVMTVFDDHYAKNTSPFDTPAPVGGSPYTAYNVGFLGVVMPYTQTLYVAEADTPTGATPQDLLDQLNNLLLSADVKVEKNGVFVGERETINFIEGANVTITAADNPGNSRVDVTIAAGGGGGGTVTSVDLTVPSPVNPAFNVTGNPIIAAGTLAINALGATTDYIRGDGSLAPFPTIPAAVTVSGRQGDTIATLSGSNYQVSTVVSPFLLMGG